MNFSLILADEGATIAETTATAETAATETVATTAEQAPQAADTGAQAAGSGIGTFVWFGFIILLMYFMMIRPQRRREKERQAMLAAVKSGDRVLFGGGILGTVANVKEKTLIVKIADNVKVEVARGAVTQLLAKGEAPAEEKQA